MYWYWYWYLEVRYWYLYWYLDHWYWYWYWYLFVEYLIQDWYMVAVRYSTASSTGQMLSDVWNLDMFPWTFPSDISPGNHCLK